MTSSSPLLPHSGLKTALVEKDDFSSGTSCKSTKLIHGGVRYLYKAVLGLDYEQVSEDIHMYVRMYVCVCTVHICNVTCLCVPCGHVHTYVVRMYS